MPEEKQPTPEETEKAYWEKMRSNLDEWWSGTMKKYEDERKTTPPKSEPGTSRTGGKRVTLPGLIADMVFGPEKD
jgi:hypothetical protein